MTYLLDEPPLPDPAAGRPGDDEAAAAGAPGGPPSRFRSTLRRASPFVAGAAVTLGAVLLYGALQPTDEAVTPADVRDAIDNALASQPPEPPAGELVYAAIRPSIVLIETEGSGAANGADGGQGTGVVVTPTGEILTAYHVVDDAETIDLTFADGSRSTASILGVDEENDIAVLSPDDPPAGVVPAVLGNPASLRIGSEAYVVGNPFGLYGSLTSGVVSGLDRSFRHPETDALHEGLIQLDAAVNPGNSGGPLVDRAGRVVGIVIALINPTEQEVFIGIGLAVPIDVAGGAAGLPPY